MRIGLYGGTFNPIHHGHLALAECARASLALDQLLFIPTGVPPLKGRSELVAGTERLAMVQLAIAGQPAFACCDFEVRRPHKSYTVDTVRHLAARLPTGSELFFILGDDCAANLHRWKGIDELCRLVRFAYVPRHGITLPSQTPALLPIDMPPLTISSTLLRQRLAAGLSIDELTPPAVVQHIQRQRLYQTPAVQPTEACSHA